MKKVDILSYLPLIFHNIREFYSFTEAENKELEAVYSRCGETLENLFIDTASEEGVRRFEKLLGILPSGDLDARKFRVKALLYGRSPVTVNSLKKQLASICGEGKFQLEVDVTNAKISVYLALDAREKVQSVHTLLEEIVPANMEIEVGIIYKTYGIFSEFTHSDLSQFTHKTLKEGGVL